MKTIKPHLLPTEQVFADALCHAQTLLAALEHAGPVAVCVMFDAFTEQHPAEFRSLRRLLPAAIPESAGRLDCVVDLPAQRWFFLRASQPEIVRDGILAALRRTGLLRFARVFVCQHPRTLCAAWPPAGECLDFLKVGSDLRPPPPAIGACPSPEINVQSKTLPWGRDRMLRVTQLLCRLIGPAADDKAQPQASDPEAADAMTARTNGQTH